MAASQKKSFDFASEFRFLIIYKVRKKIRTINPSINDWKIYSKRLCTNFRPIDEADFEISRYLNSWIWLFLKTLIFNIQKISCALNFFELG